ncbi:glycine--tRNA ligase subunit beta, partial [Enterobacter hormaechei]|nr:glycine--tRNA ligase subunit beta [Enterobacter hormaechei]
KVDVSTLKAPEEVKLATHLIVLQDKLAPLFAEGHYQEALVELASLREVVDAFFDNVMVMDEDLQVRVNRLTLLSELRDLFLRVADISLLQ